MKMFSKLFSIISKFTEKYIFILVSITFILISCKSIPSLFNYGYLSIPFQIFLIIGSIKIIKKQNFISLMLIIIYFLWISLTAFWSPYPENTIIRSTFFLFNILASVSAINLYRVKKSDFNYLIPVNLFIVLISSISLLFQFPVNRFSGGNAMGFMGFVAHQNTLAALLFFTTIPYIKNIIDSKKIVWSIPICINLFFIFLTYSRTAIIISGIFLIILVLKYFFNKKLLYGLALLTITSISILGFSDQAYDMTKNYFNKSGEKFLDRRKEYIEVSYKAASNGGFIGQGFGVSDTSLIRTHMGAYENGVFRREKMVSVFALIEETGIIGLILFLIPFIIFSTREYQKNGITFNLIYLLIIFIYCQIEGFFVGVNNIFINIIYILIII